MTVLRADPKLEAYLAPLHEQTEIRGTQGRLLGVFIPAEACAAVNADVRALFDPEEIKRIKKSEGDHPGYTTDEVLEYLQTLEKPS